MNESRNYEHFIASIRARIKHHWDFPLQNLHALWYRYTGHDLKYQISKQALIKYFKTSPTIATAGGSISTIYSQNSFYSHYITTNPKCGQEGYKKYTKIQHERILLSNVYKKERIN